MMASAAKYWYLLVIGSLTVFSVLFFTGRTSSSISNQKIPEVVDFNFHIRPILSDRCFKCHGPDAVQRKANLRLDTEAGLYQSLKDNADGHIVVKGEPEHSALYRRLMETDTSQVMPPPSANLVVSDFEKELIRKWIDQGAKYEKHWAFISPGNEKPPDDASSGCSMKLTNLFFKR